MRTAIDTNILSALWGGEESATRISAALDAAAAMGSLVICPVVYVEARGYRTATESFVDDFLSHSRIDVDWKIEQPLWQLAAARFDQYARRRQEGGGGAKRLAADFVVGAHALLRADRLITLDQRRYRADFPDLTLMEM